MSAELYTLVVSPHGDDGWSGQLPEPWPDRGDGPLATLATARDRIAARRALGRLHGPARVLMRGGRYELAEPLHFGPEHGHVTYQSYPGERVQLSGGRRIGGWRVAHHNGRDCWVAQLPEVAAGDWWFTQLWVNGVRRLRPRRPKASFHRFADVPQARFSANALDGHFDGSDRFVLQPGDLPADARNLGDVEVVALHFWIEERLPLASVDPASGLAISTHHSAFMLRDDIAARWANYYVENLFEALDTPGEWYLDRAAGRLIYLPLPGEEPERTEVIAPALDRLVLVAGDAASGQPVEGLRFVGLEFAHGAQPTPEDPRIFFPHNAFADTGGKPFAAAPQAACNVPAALSFVGAHGGGLERCRVAHIGGYAVELGAGSRDVGIRGCELTDLGAGGVRLNGVDIHGPHALRSGEHEISDTRICAAGRIFPSAVGVLLMHSYGNRIVHNQIFDLFYSGISCGWSWGYGEQVARDNLIAYNHIHSLGQRLLSDMGGIYTLGVQPGTVIRGNRIHGIEKANYGGWAIYCDEGSSHILIEGNCCYDTSSHGFHQHYGRENILRNNLFAFCREGLVALGRHEGHIGFTLERNILISVGGPALVGGVGRLERGGVISDLNLLWDVTGEAPHHGNAGHDEQARWRLDRRVELGEWQALGHDRHSLVADPSCADLGRRDFTLAPDSPAFALGFAPDKTPVGPRKGEV
jgi:hypothetical protein